MFSVFRKCKTLPNKNLIIRSTSSYFFPSKTSLETSGTDVTFHKYSSVQVNLCQRYNGQFLDTKSNLYSHLVKKRYFSKKKGSKQRVEEEDSDEDEDDDNETVIEEYTGDSVVTKSLPSLRIDTILKAGLGVPKKKIEQDFYALKLRVNGEKVVKKSLNVFPGSEIDRIRGFSPDTSKLLLVDRVIIKGIDKITGAGMYPVRMEVFKGLVIENYEDPWRPDSLALAEK